MTYLERLNDFFAYAHVNRLSAASQLTYLTLLDKWNSLRRPLTFVCSINEISRLSNLSTSRVSDALHNLTSRHLLKIVRNNKYSEFILPENPIGMVDRNVSETNRQGPPPLRYSDTNISSTKRVKEEAATPEIGRGSLINVSYTMNELKAKWNKERVPDAERDRVVAKAKEYMEKMRIAVANSD